MEVNVAEVNKSIKDTKILSDVSFQALDGECMGIVGPNGAGKTTLILTMLGLYDFSGSVKYDNTDIRDTNACDQGILFMLDHSGLFITLNVRENLEFFYRAYHETIDKDKMNEKLDEILEKINLTDYANAEIKQLSRGMKQRLSYGKTMVAQPSVLILDEPYTALDVEGQIFLTERLIELKKTGTTIIISSHDIGHLQKVCDSVLFIKHGKVLRKIYDIGSESDIIEKTYREFMM